MSKKMNNTGHATGRQFPAQLFPKCGVEVAFESTIHRSIVGNKMTIRRKLRQKRDELYAYSVGCVSRFRQLQIMCAYRRMEYVGN